jgi:hypothetical protein
MSEKNTGIGGRIKKHRARSGVFFVRFKKLWELFETRCVE